MQPASLAQPAEIPTLTPTLRAARALGEATVTGDNSELRDILAGMSVREIYAFTKALDAEEPAFMAQVWAGEAWAPGGRMWRAAAGFRDRLDAEATTERKRWRAANPPDARRRTLTRLAFAALQARQPAIEMLLALHTHNAGLPNPLPANDVDRLAVWCAERARETAHA